MAINSVNQFNPLLWKAGGYCSADKFDANKSRPDAVVISGKRMRHSIPRPSWGHENDAGQGQSQVHLSGSTTGDSDQGRSL